MLALIAELRRWEGKRWQRARWRCMLLVGGCLCAGAVLCGRQEAGLAAWSVMAQAGRYQYINRHLTGCTALQASFQRCLRSSHRIHNIYALCMATSKRKCFLVISGYCIPVYVLGPARWRLTSPDPRVCGACRTDWAASNYSLKQHWYTAK